MSFQIITSASNTVTKSLGAVDNIVDGVSLATEIFKDSMETARLEQQDCSLCISRRPGKRIHEIRFPHR